MLQIDIGKSKYRRPHRVEKEGLQACKLNKDEDPTELSNANDSKFTLIQEKKIHTSPSSTKLDQKS